MTSWTTELDEAAELATRTGCWHSVLFYLLCALAAVPTSFLIFSQVFTNATPEHWCAPSPELEVLDLPDDLVKSLTVPKTKGPEDQSYESCRAYTLDPRALHAALSDYVDERTDIVREDGALRTVRTRKLVPAKGEAERKEQVAKVTDAILALRSQEPAACTNGWKYSTEQYKNTLVTEFNLVCEHDWLPRTSNTLFWVGSIFGNLFFGWMSDRYGRRPTILLMILLEVPLAIAASFSSSYGAYTALRVAGGLFFPALYQQPFILALELMPPAKRTSAGIVVGMMFAGGMCMLALLAFFARDWYPLSLLTSLPFVVLFGFFWLTPESPRWLVGRGRVAEAECVLMNIAKRNGISLPKGFLLELHRKIKEQEDTEAILLRTNGHVTGFPFLREKEEFIDRRISNMLTFKPEPKPEENLPKPDSLERIIALEVADIVNKRSKVKKDTIEIPVEETQDEESPFNTEAQQKATQTETYRDSPLTIRKKSVQLVSRMFKESPESAENKIIDEQNSEGDCKASPLDIFRYPNIRKKFIILTFNWVSLGVVYNSLSYNTPNLGVNDYLAFFIGGAVELPSYFLAWRCMERYGRRWVLCLFSAVGGLACLCCLFVPDDWPWVTVSLAMLGRLCIAASFAVFYVQLGELLPTVLRAQAMGAASFVAGLGLLACPYIVHLAVYSRALPLSILGALALAAGGASLLLPETLRQPLPQTLGDGELFGRSFRVFSCVQGQDQ